MLEHTSEVFSGLQATFQVITLKIGNAQLLKIVLLQVIFITTLFYLLAISGEHYKPVEWFVNLSPAAGSTGNRFGLAVEEAIGLV